MTGGPTQGYYFGVGAPILVYFSGDWDIHGGYGLLTHGHMIRGECKLQEWHFVRWKRGAHVEVAS